MSVQHTHEKRRASAVPLRGILVLQVVALCIFVAFGIRRVILTVSYEPLRKQVDLSVYAFDEGLPTLACRRAGKPTVQMFSRALDAFTLYAPKNVMNASADFRDWEAYVNSRRSRWESFTRRFWAFSSGLTVIDVDDPPRQTNLVTYMRIWKSANDAIRWNLVAAAGERADVTTKMRLGPALDSSRRNVGRHRRRVVDRLRKSKIFTFVRDPISHFIAGYNECEWRWFHEFRNYSSWIPEYCHEQGCVFHTFPIGSQDRAWAFLGDLLLVRMVVGDFSAPPHASSLPYASPSRLHAATGKASTPQRGAARLSATRSSYIGSLSTVYRSTGDLRC